MSSVNSTASVEYRPIPGFPGYRAGADGSVWSKRRSVEWRELKAYKTGHGYLTMCLFSSGKRFRRDVHRIVLETFVGPRPAEQEARHIDGDRTNCALANLQWGSRKENWADRRVHGTDSIGKRHWKAKLCESHVRAIRQRAKNGEPHKTIAADFHVTRMCITNVVLRRTWRHI